MIECRGLGFVSGIGMAPMITPDFHGIVLERFIKQFCTDGGRGLNCSSTELKLRNYKNHLQQLPFRGI